MALDETDDDEDRAAIAALWVGAQGRVLDRIATIDAAVAALAAGTVQDAGTHAAGAGEAHKLAGSLGTFGLPEGSRLAKELELLLEGDAPSADEAARLAAALRAAVEAGPTA